MPSQSRPYWRKDWFACAAVALVAIALQFATDFAGGLERRFYDHASASNPLAPSAQIAIIAIDGQSVARLGRWPWPRDLDARLIDLLSAAQAHTIVHTGFFFDSQVDRGLVFARRMQEVLDAAGPAASPAAAATQQQLGSLLAQAQSALDPDGQLTASIKRAGNVIIASLLTTGQRPLEPLQAAAAGVGHLQLRPDVDGILRHETLLTSHQGEVVPSVALLAALRHLDLTPSDIRRHGNESLQIGSLRIPTDGADRALPRFYPGRDGNPAVVVDSFDDVLSGKIPASNYKDKLVVIGVTAAGVGQPLAVPGHPVFSVAEAVAHVASNILQGHFLAQPRWGAWAVLAALALVCAYLILVLPRLATGAAALITLFLLLTLLGVEFAMLSMVGVWMKLVFPAVLLAIAQLALVGKRILMTDAAGPRAATQPAETERMMGLALQGQGQLDMAFERYLRAPVGDAVLGNLNSLARDFERNLQFKQAQAVYDYMAVHAGQGAKVSASPPTLAQGHSAMGTSGMLGRYRLQQELGKGAMGVVYLGKDTKIGRVVALKTMALCDEFEGVALIDARERFFREAETAGRLQHQNIVTIFDAGEDNGLAYIAMEFLKGKDLVDYCKSGNLLPIPTVLSIGARVADALAYAHRQQVVHRDIKPANVMFDMESDTVKVTDFGIARITDSNKTRTGLVLGTPSFMSPEQLAGKKVDGRSDLYSLGVMLFQMLTGKLPFRGESLAGLMHKIAVEEAPDIRSIRQDLSGELAILVAVALAKQPQARYQVGDQMATDLRTLLSGGSAIDLEI